MRGSHLNRNRDNTVKLNYRVLNKFLIIKKSRQLRFKHVHKKRTPYYACYKYFLPNLHRCHGTHVFMTPRGQPVRTDLIKIICIHDNLIALRNNVTTFLSRIIMSQLK